MHEHACLREEGLRSILDLSFFQKKNNADTGADTNIKFQVEEAFKKFDTSGDQRWVFISVNFDF